MEQIPNKSSEERPISDYDLIRKEFKSNFSKLIEPFPSIVNQLNEFIKSKRGEISESDANTSLEDEIFKITSSFIQKKFDFIIERLKEELDYIVKNYSSSVLDNIFDILIDILIQKFKQQKKIFFISLEQIYEVFYHFGFRIIPRETLEKLTGALQWDIIPPFWLKYNFLKDYSKKILIKKEIANELKNKTWTLLELTRIKEKKFERKKRRYHSILDFI